MRPGVFAAACLVAAPAVVAAQGLDGGVTVVSAATARSPGATSLRGAEAAEQPLVEHDALKVVQGLPGVSLPPLGSSEVVVWGAAPGETRVLVDGVEVPVLYHLGGYRSVVASSLVGRLTLEPAAFRADVGRGLGGTVRVETAGVAPGLHGSLAADGSDVSGAASYGGDVAGMAAAARLSTLAALVRPFLSARAQDRFPLPESWDAQLKGTLRTGEGEELSLLGLASADASRLEVSSEDPTLARSRREARDFYRLGLTWRRGDSEESFSATSFVGLDRRAMVLATPLASASLDEEAWKAGLKARARVALGPSMALATGFDGLVSRSTLAREGPLTRPAREGDVTAFGAPLSDVRAADTWTVHEVDAAIFAELELFLGRLSLTPGLRLAAVGGDVSRRTPRVAATPSVGASALDFALEPRAVVAWVALPWLTVTASGGLSHQAPEARDRSAVFGTPVLHPARGAHVAAGLRAQPLAGLGVEATGFYRTSSGLTVRNDAAKASLAQLMLETGEGRAAGLQVHLTLRPVRGLSGSVAYTLSRGERRSSPEASWRLADFDRTHVVTMLAGYALDAWRFGVRLRWASGEPRTPVLSGSADLRRGVYEPTFGAHNGSRLPDFFQLDAEVSRGLLVGRVRVELFVELMNLTNRHNVEEWVYDTTFTRREALWGLPFFGLLGVRVSL